MSDKSAGEKEIDQEAQSLSPVQPENEQQDFNQTLPLPTPVPQESSTREEQFATSNNFPTSSAQSILQQIQSKEKMNDKEVEESNAFSMASLVEALQNISLTPPTGSSSNVPYDANLPHNKKRLEIEAVMEKFYHDEQSITDADLEKLKYPIEKWEYTPKANKKAKKKFAGDLVKLNEERIRIRSLLKLPTRTLTPVPITKEFIPEISLDKYRETRKEKKSPNKEKCKFEHIRPKVDTGLQSPQTPRTPSTPQSPGPSPPKKKFTFSSKDQSIYQAATPKQGRLSEEINTKDQILLELSTISPSFADECNTKCSTKETLEYFRNVSKKIRDMKGHWVLRIDSERDLKKITTIIPVAEIEKMMKFIDSKNLPIILANNAFLMDAVFNCYAEACVQVFDESYNADGSEKLIDYRSIMDSILTTMMRRMYNNGISLPPFDLSNIGKKNPSKGNTGTFKGGDDNSVATPKTKRNRKKKILVSVSNMPEPDDVIKEDMIPENLRKTYYHEFIGKSLKANWSAGGGYVLSYKDGMGFIPGNGLNMNTYEALITKLFASCPRALCVKFRLIVWSEIQPIQNFEPDLSGKRLEECKEFLILKDKFKNDTKQQGKKIGTVFVTVPIGDYGQAMLVYVPSEKNRLNIFIPAQSDSVFSYWMGNNKERQMFAQKLQYARLILDKLKITKHQDWKQFLEIRPKPPLENIWPFNVSSFIQSQQVEQCTIPLLEPIYCAMWFETITNPSKFEKYDENFRIKLAHVLYPNMKNDFVGKDGEDVRGQYLRLLSDMA